MRPLDLVNVRQGTDSHVGFSTGNTLPITARPFGMNHWVPQTAEGNWFFSPHDRKIAGVRCTHQPSPWIGDYGWFTLLPQVGVRKLDFRHRVTSYVPGRWSPAEFTAELPADGIGLEVAPTLRGAIFRFRFPEGVPGRVILQMGPAEGGLTAHSGGRLVTGFTRYAAGGVPEGFACYFALEFDVPLDRATFSVHGEEQKGERIVDREPMLAAEWDVAPGVACVRVATSFISEEQAVRNLRRELGNRTYEEVRAASEREWEKRLGLIQVRGGTETQQRTFATCLYRTQLFPRVFFELDESGNPVHYSPFSGGVHPGVLYTDNGFWDTYRTEYPLLALLDPGRLAEILQGWTNAYREGGWFPQWASPGYRACMVGTHIDAVMADGIARGVTDFDVETAFEGMWRHAHEVGDPAGAWGRIGIEDYLELGYVSNRFHESVGRSLDYAYDDWCIAQVARTLGRTDEAQQLEARAGNYRHLWDPAVGFFRARTPEGSWQEPWREFRWGNPYVEGGPWQFAFSVPHDVPGLADLMGGPEQLVAKLEAMLVTPPRFEVGAYGIEIHEMTEMAVAGFGQYAHSNQPVHHALYLFAAAGRPDLTAHWVRRVMNELYSPDRLPGDEDNGEMAAWYVLSAIGKFPHCPGRAEWTEVPSIFDSVEIHPMDRA